MTSWLARGVAIAVALVVLWTYGASHAPWPEARLAIAAAGGFVLAWLVPLWWTVDTVLALTGRMLKAVQSSLDAVEAEAIYTEAVQTGRAWVVVTSEWALRRYRAPAWVAAAAPLVWDVVAPLFRMPLDGGVEVVKARAHIFARRWRRRLLMARLLWLTLTVAPPAVTTVYWWARGTGG